MSKPTQLACVLCCLLAGCFYPAERGRALEARVDRLRQDDDALRADLEKTRAQLQETLPKVEAKIAEVTHALETLDKAARRTDADTGVQLQKNVEDVAMLRGQVDTFLHRLEELDAALKATQDDVTQKLATLQGSEAAKAAEAKKKLDELERPQDAQGYLQLADQKAKAGDTALARQLYAELIKKWPKDERAAQAHFGLGETWFGEDRCREALSEYGKVIQQYGHSPVAPQAYLRSSECFKKLSMNDESKLSLEQVVKEFPKAPEAKTAKAKLEELKKKPAPKAAPKKGKK